MKKIDKTIFKDVTLLYVEDDEMTLEEISFFLKKYVKELIVAKNGKEGLELFKKHNPDMVITDIQMPIMNGLDMSEQILQLKPDIPIAITTAYSDGDYLIKAIGLGIDKYLLKPINMIEVLAVIQKALNLGKCNGSKVFQENCDDYIEFILDSNPTFMFILHANKIEYANKRFLDLLGHEDISSLKEHIKNSENIFELEDLDVDDNWMEYLINNSDKVHVVSLNNQITKHKSKFYVSHKYFKSTNKSVFAFTDVKEDKLNRIDEIVNDLLEQDDLNSYILDSINRISSITKG